MKHLRVLIATFVLVSAWASGQGATNKATVEISTTSVTAVGMTPGARVAWLAASRERPQWVTTVQKWVTTDSVADASGRARVNIDLTIPVKSIWIAVDMATGAVAAASPAKYPWRTEVPFPFGGVVEAEDRSGVASIRDSHNDLDVLVVRPTVGAWSLSAHHDDAESRGAPGTLLDFKNLAAMPGSPDRPTILVGGDVVVAIDPERMEFFAQQLGSSR